MSTCCSLRITCIGACARGRHAKRSLSCGAGTALSLTLRYSRTMEGPHYLGSVAVIYTEAIKLVICLGVQLLHCRRAPKLHGNGDGWQAEFMAQSKDILSHSLPMALPAALFVMQQV